MRTDIAVKKTSTTLRILRSTLLGFLITLCGFERTNRLIAETDIIHKSCVPSSNPSIIYDLLVGDM